jgi:hypothetical protein
MFQYLHVLLSIAVNGISLANIKIELRKKGRMIRATGAALFISTLISLNRSLLSSTYKNPLWSFSDLLLQRENLQSNDID